MTQVQRVIASLEPGGATVADIVDETGIPDKSVRAVLSRLTRDGVVSKRRLTGQPWRLYELASR